MLPEYIPLTFIALAINILVWSILLTRGSSETAPSYEPSCIISNTLLLHEYFDCGSPYFFNGVTWSLSIEMGLYVLLPLFLLLFIKRPLGGLAFCLFLISYVIPELVENNAWLVLPNFIRGITTFVLGIIVFKYKDFVKMVPIPKWTISTLTIAIIAEMNLGVNQLIIILSLMVLFIISVSADLKNQADKPIQKLFPLGQLTYSIYIWHSTIVLVFINVISDKLFYGNTFILVSATIFAYALIFTIGYFSYIWLETPSRKKLQNIFR